MSLISIIIPVFNEEENLPVIYSRLDQLAPTLGHEIEILFVDDGSSDNSFRVAQGLAAKDKRVRVVSFSRNFGSHAACLAGLIKAKGDACTFLAADLQDPPELLKLMIAEWEKGIEVVIGVREWQKGSSRIIPNLYYSMVRKLALRNMPESGTDVFFIDKKVASAVSEMREKNTSIFGLILWSGFTQSLITYKKGEREKGVSKWTLSKKIKLFVDTFVSFSYFPIRMISLIGIALALAGLFYALLVIVNRLLGGQPVEGWSSLMVVLLLVSGVQMIMLGVIGEYLWRNFDESRKRPPFIIREMVGFSDASRKDS